MTLKKIIVFICAVAFSAPAGFNTISVPQLMLHGSDAGTGTGFSGKVEYTVTASDTDSVYVALTITSQAGTPLQLSEITGDVGLIRIVHPNTAEKHVIFFQTQTVPDPGVHYVAHLTADAVISGEKTQVEGFLAIMTKSQKASIMGGVDNFDVVGAGPIPRLKTADGPHGVRMENGSAATLYPCCSNEACTWDTALAYIQGLSKGEEFRACGKNCSLGPALNLVYHPLGGRASEYYGEDPYESGIMAASDARGLQAKGVIATAKHYACNNKEDNRRFLSANIGERAMREIYLENWRPIITQANCAGVMGAYNRVNHNYANSNKFLMTDVLRNEWGFKYGVMTDWSADFDYTLGIQYGCDIDMASPDTYVPSTVAYQPDSILNMHARRIIYMHEMAGAFTAGYSATAFTSTFKSTDHAKVSRQVGTAGIVLAKNDTMAASPNGLGTVLPLPKTDHKIALTGPFLSQFRAGPGGSSAVNPALQVIPSTAIANLLNGMGGYPANPGKSTIVSDITTADYIVVFVGVTGEHEDSDRPSLSILPADGETAVASALAVTTAKTIVVYTGGSAATPGNWSKADAIVFAFYPGEMQGNCIADVLFGLVNPSGKLPVTFPALATQLPPFAFVSGSDLNYPSSDTAHGYFRFDKNNWTPLFYFGHGLSYTTFEYSPLNVYPDTIHAGDRVHVRLTVKNTGHVAGKETAELYLSMPANNSAGLPVRVQDLRGFQKVPLDPTKTLDTAATAAVDFTLYPEDMRVFNPNGVDYNGSGTWQILPGTYTVRVGTSADRSRQPTQSATFTVLE
jgi:beta-glucosidase